MMWHHQVAPHEQQQQQQQQQQWRLEALQGLVMGLRLLLLLLRWRLAALAACGLLVLAGSWCCRVHKVRVGCWFLALRI
jgi:uncharacterized membrane protein